MIYTLPVDSVERKNYPVATGFLNYCPAAIAGAAAHSVAGNAKHNPGQPLHHARGKSGDHADCIVRHIMDLSDILATIMRGGNSPELNKALLTEANAMFWRAGMWSQELHETFGGAPLAPAARLPQSPSEDVEICYANGVPRVRPAEYTWKDSL